MIFTPVHPCMPYFVRMYLKFCRKAFDRLKVRNMVNVQSSMETSQTSSLCLDLLFDCTSVHVFFYPTCSIKKQSKAKSI